MKMERSIILPLVVDKAGWQAIIIEEDFVIPAEVSNPQAFIEREKITRYIHQHPLRIYHYTVEDNLYEVDCMPGSHLVRKRMEAKRAAQQDIDMAVDLSSQFHYFFGRLSDLSKRAYGNKSKAGGILESHGEDLLDLFGRLHSIDEVHKIVVQDWGLALNRHTLEIWYSRNLKEIDRLRDQYASDYSDVALTKKRARLDKRSVMFYTYYNKWMNDPRIEYARLMLQILDQIEKEVEGENININIQGQINVDMTIEVNKSLYEAQKRVPMNNMILAMVAAKRGIDPTKLMTQLTTSYYRNITGFGVYEPDKQLVHPVDLTYNWNEIERKHRTKDKSVVIEDAQIVESTGRLESDAALNTIKGKLLELLEKDKTQNDKRRSGK
jgi:hypothetical protein